MLVETGRIVALESDSLWVETIRRSSCGSCAAQKGCGHGLINSVSDGRRSYVRVLPGKLALSACALDDEVKISIPEEVVLHGSLVVYIMPLVGMLSGAIAAAALFPATQDPAAALGAVAGFAVALAGVRWHAWRHRNDTDLQPTLLEVTRSAALPPGLG